MKQIGAIGLHAFTEPDKVSEPASLAHKDLGAENVIAELKKQNERIYIKAPHVFEEQADDDAPLEVSLADLMVAYQKVRDRISIDRPRNITVRRESVSREAAEAFLRQRFEGKRTLGLRDLFTFSESKPKVVAVFITLLDFVKDNQLAIRPRGHEDFEIERLYD